MALFLSDLLPADDASTPDGSIIASPTGGCGCEVGGGGGTGAGVLLLLALAVIGGARGRRSGWLRR